MSRLVSLGNDTERDVRKARGIGIFLGVFSRLKRHVLHIILVNCCRAIDLLDQKYYQQDIQRSIQWV